MAALLWWGVGGYHCAWCQGMFAFTAYDGNAGFVQKEVMNIAQDARGLMWFSTWDGLYQFDGSRFTSFKARPGDGIRLESNRMETICPEGNGIWMRGYNGSVSRYDMTTSRITSLPLSHYAAREMYGVGGGMLVVTDDNRLLRVSWHDDSLRVKLLLNAKASINGLKSGRGQEVWVLTSRALWLYDPRAGQPRLMTTAFDGHDMCLQPEGEVFCGSGGTLLTRQGGRLVRRQLPTAAPLSSVVPLPGGGYLVSAIGDGLYVLDAQFAVRQHHTMANSVLNGDCIRRLVSDSQGNVWFCTGSPGVMRYDARSGMLERLTMKGQFSQSPSMWRNDVRIIEDSRHHLWVSPSGNGLALYDPARRMLVPFYDPARQREWTAENTVVDLFVDRQDNLWFSGKYTGLQKATFTSSQFKPLDMHADTEDGNDVRGIFQDRDGYVWTGARDGTISVFDRQMHYLGNLTRSGHVVPNSTDRLGHAYCFVQDKEGNLWIGTKFGGLFRLRRQGQLSYDIRQYKKGDDPYSLCHNDIFSMCIDGHDRLWIATFGGGICYLDLRQGSGRFIHAGNRLLGYPKGEFQRVRYVTTDRRGNIWAGTTSGLLSFDGSFTKPEHMHFKTYKRMADDLHSLSNNDVQQIFFSREGTMYVCTYGGGFCAVREQGGRLFFEPYTMADGLRSDIVFTMQEDDRGHLWLSSESGLARFYPRDRRIEAIPTYFFDQRVDFNEGAAVRLDDGRLLFPARNHGPVYFNPAQMVMSRYVPRIVITRLFIGQAEVTPSAQPGAIIACTPEYLDQLVLRHDQNNFSIEFSALDFRNPENINYSYKLEGFDRQWNNIGRRHSAIYSNLPPGSYTLLVRSTNGDGVWVDNVRSLPIVIKPSFWQTWWAYALYLLAVIAVMVLSSYILYTVFKLKHKVRMEQRLSDLKVKFFTEVSHEIRTPLTLIAGSIKELLRKGVADEDVQRRLLVVDDNADHLLRLMTQFLDIRKIENGKMRLNLRQVDLGEFMQSIIGNFANLAQDQDIDLTLDRPTQPVMIWGDTEKLDQVFFNLLSNAFRFTPNGKRITVSVRQSTQGAIVSVADEGCGIARERLARIFTLFDSSSEGSVSAQPSSGVGLALTRELVELHRGTIHVESEMGRGSIFTVTLAENAPGSLPEADYMVSDDEVPPAPQHAVPNLPAAPTTEDDDTARGDKEGETVLVIDDNAQMREFIRLILQEQYHVIEAADGHEGLRRTEETMPDIIITDYMMPVMDGMEMARRLKGSVNTSHIPIIILSAKSDEQSVVEGLGTGVDAYMQKPFSSDVLRAMVGNVIKRRAQLQQYYLDKYVRQETTPTALTDVSGMNLADRRFMERLTTLIHEHMGNGSLSVDDMASLMGMSRSVYFKKLKALTGLGPNDYLKQVRIRRAVELLDTGLYAIADIAVMVGFNDAHYFSKCFKAIMGKTPSEWQQR